jgi:hypothetical protein
VATNHSARGGDAHGFTLLELAAGWVAFGFDRSCRIKKTQGR